MKIFGFYLSLMFILINDLKFTFDYLNRATWWHILHGVVFYFHSSKICFMLICLEYPDQYNKSINLILFSSLEMVGLWVSYNFSKVILPTSTVAAQIITHFRYKITFVFVSHLCKLKEINLNEPLIQLFINSTN